MTDTLDLHITRTLPASPEALWRCWVDPTLLCRWFTPSPVETVAADIQPEPGGRFMTRMRMPDGTEVENEGMILQAEPARRLVFTDAMGPGFRPRPGGFMTAILSFTPDDGGTRYHADVLHASPQDRARHEEMGFHEGWGQAIDQLSALAMSLKP